ncbi:hypothetical protein [Haloplasma contractile]|uniref:Uncharacterized protein n=1 Tax=Haloplasma contractile SSD-17B TaxID=1033810 RepID=F7PRC1_9MOLU|nr:hypothetical protein [Haloplasma contractile]ERJ11753.1 hypothetical protein HLPCO_002236 [Haloplasma contractile SSD-17B]
MDIDYSLIRFIVEAIDFFLDIKDTTDVNPDKEMNLTNILNTADYDTKITSLVITAITLSYADDGKLDKQEKRIIKRLIKDHRQSLSKEAIKNIKYIKRHQMNKERLFRLYSRLNVNKQTALTIIDELDSLLDYSQSNIIKKRTFLKELKTDVIIRMTEYNEHSR